MNRNNPLNYSPLMADALLAGGKEAAAARAEIQHLILTDILIGGSFCDEGTTAARYHKTYSRLLKRSLILAIPAFLLLLVLAICGTFDLPETLLVVLAVVLLVPGVAFFFMITATLICMVRYRGRLLDEYIADYTPRCTELSPELRNDLAVAGYCLFFSPEEWAELSGDPAFVEQVCDYWELDPTQLTEGGLAE